jgi:hypothetical protein
VDEVPPVLNFVNQEHSAAFDRERLKCKSVQATAAESCGTHKNLSVVESQLPDSD